MVLLAPTVQVAPDGEDVTARPVIGEPPFEVGAVNETVAVVAPVIVADTDVGTLGVVAVTILVAVEVSVRFGDTPFDAVTTVLMYLPTSASETTYVLDVAPAISTHWFASDELVHLFH